MVVVGTLSIALFYGIVEYTFNDEGDLNSIPSVLEKVFDLLFFIFLFPWSLIEYLIKLTGTDVIYSSTARGQILVYSGFILNLIIQYFIFRWIRNAILKWINTRKSKAH